MPAVISKMATIECSTCSTLLEVYPQDEPGQPNLCWNALDANQCKAPPLNRCPHALAEVKRRFASSTGKTLYQRAVESTPPTAFAAPRCDRRQMTRRITLAELERVTRQRFESDELVAAERRLEKRRASQRAYLQRTGAEG